MMREKIELVFLEELYRTKKIKQKHTTSFINFSNSSSRSFSCSFDFNFPQLIAIYVTVTHELTPRYKCLPCPFKINISTSNMKNILCTEMKYKVLILQQVN